MNEMRVLVADATELQLLSLFSTGGRSEACANLHCHNSPLLILIVLQSCTQLLHLSIDQQTVILHTDPSETSQKCR